MADKLSFHGATLATGSAETINVLSRKTRWDTSKLRPMREKHNARTFWSAYSIVLGKQLSFPFAFDKWNMLSLDFWGVEPHVRFPLNFENHAWANKAYCK